MIPTKLAASLLALALCWGAAASAQDTTAQSAPATATEPGAAAADAAPGTEAAPTGAATTQAAATEVPATGRIVFFRPKKFAGGAIVFKIREGDTVLGKLSSGSYFAVDVPAGTHEYYAKSEGKDDTLVMEVEAGETYYVSGSISLGMLAGQGNLSPSDQAAFDAANSKKLKDRTGEKVD
jgi:Protein of unknown function (DUF2846)